MTVICLSLCKWGLSLCYLSFVFVTCLLYCCKSWRWLQQVENVRTGNFFILKQLLKIWNIKIFLASQFLASKMSYIYAIDITFSFVIAFISTITLLLYIFQVWNQTLRYLIWVPLVYYPLGKFSRLDRFRLRFNV